MNLRSLLLIALLATKMLQAQAQVKLNTRLFNKNGEATITQHNQVVEITWPTGKTQFGKVQFDLSS